MTDWQEAQEWERKWWGNCINTYGEETKQLHYTQRMSLVVQYDNYGPFIDMTDKSVIDIGGGPVSLLLKCRGLKRGLVVDPCAYPDWVTRRYIAANIELLSVPAEQLKRNTFDEVWCYNVLQHVEDPAKVVENMRKYGRLIRIFDWLGISGPGHPNMLTRVDMDKWLGGEGQVTDGNGAQEYFGIFKGDFYEA